MTPLAMATVAPDTGQYQCLVVRCHWGNQVIGAFLTFLVLFALIKIFERKRDDLDNFNIVTVAIVPIIAVVLVAAALGMFYPQPTLQRILPPVVLISLTFLLLWKNLEIPAGRSIGYTVAVVLVNEGLGFLVASASTN